MQLAASTAASASVSPSTGDPRRAASFSPRLTYQQRAPPAAGSDSRPLQPRDLTPAALPPAAAARAPLPPQHRLAQPCGRALAAASAAHGRWMGEGVGRGRGRDARICMAVESQVLPLPQSHHFMRGQCTQSCRADRLFTSTHWRPPRAASEAHTQSPYTYATRSFAIRVCRLCNALHERAHLRSPLHRCSVR